jgi:hypothetical protein
MLIHRTIIALASLAIVALADDARASCAGPVSCVCAFDNKDMVASFTGVIMEGGGKAFASNPASLKVRIDEITQVEGATTQLVAGSVVDATVFLQVDVKPGDSILGFSQPTCANTSEGCPGITLDKEAIEIRAVFDAAGLLRCHLTPTGISPTLARELLADPNCDADLLEKLHTTEPEIACHDTNCLFSVAGGRTDRGASFAIGFFALVAAWRLRRALR